jgi:hypothetical protein
MRIWKCGFAFTAKMKVGCRWAAAEAPSLDRYNKECVNMLNEVQLGAKALIYIKNELSNGNSMAQIITQYLPLEDGKITSFLPNDVIGSEIDNYGESVAYDYHGMYRESHEVIVDFIKAYLSGSNERIAITETLGQINDPFVKRLHQYFHFATNVYLFLSSNDSDQSKIIDMVKCDRGYPFITILTSLGNKSDQLRSGEEIPKDYLEGFVNRTEQIIIGAFDQDGFLIWHNPH